jgi:hypothetical protein
LSSLWFVHGHCIGQYMKELNCNLCCRFHISGDASMGVICYNLFIPSTYKGSTEMETHCLRTVTMFCLPLQVI